MDSQHAPGPERQKTILLVDDDARIVKFVYEILTHRNYSVLTAGSGSDALALSRESSAEIDLLLSDFQMPGMSGIELATAVTHDRPNVKVLLMSGFPDGMLVLNEGWHFLAKPFITSQLCALVSGLINQGSAL
jgi:DNA-binding NtrC family response regulator